MKNIFTFLFSLLLFINSYSIIPPKKGVTPPANFSELKQNIEKDYKSGFYARKMEARQLLREKIKNGSLSKSALNTDTVFALTLLGKYSDSEPMYSTIDFQQKLFDGPNPTGTLKDFYNEISYGQMYMSGKCIGWYPVPGTMASYVGSNTGLGSNGGAKFVYDLVVASDNDINYANYIQYYDTQGNPRIGFIAAVHTGADAAAGANNIWSHRWTFTVYSNAPYTTNDIDPVSGKKVIIDGDYAIEPELSGSNNNNGNLIDIGVFAHEFGHIFGLPDLYDTDNSSEGLGNWCLMAGGSYGGNGNTSSTPVHMSAWCKQKLGWVTPIDITSFQANLSVPNVEQNPIVYKMWKQNLSGGLEYFLIENRQLISFDKNNYNPGLLIYHVDDAMSSNRNENHYKVDLEQADGLRQLNTGANRGDFGDPFPGSTFNKKFDYSSVPNSNSYLSGATYVSVRNITLEGTLAKADFDIGTRPYLSIKNLNAKETIAQNGRLEAGEIGSLTLNMVNIEPTASSQTKIKFFINDPNIQILLPEKALNIKALENDTITVDSVFKVKPDFNSKMVTVKYEVTSDGNSFIDSAKVIVGIPEVLIVSKAENRTFIDYYSKALRDNGIEPEELLNSEPRFISKRSTIIYLTGVNKDSLFSDSEIDSLTKFANNKGNLILSGQNIAEFLKLKYPLFLSDQVGINWVKNGTTFYRNVYGKTDDVIGAQINHLQLLGTEGARNEKTPDVISSTGNFNVSFSYKQDMSEAAGGWKLMPNGGKIIFLGFGFESISDVESSTSRKNIMDIMLSQFGNPVNVSDNKYLPKEFSLSQNYPNPFNPSTKINYSIATQSIVRLELFDITGRRIAILVNKDLPQGSYEVNINMSELNISSGVYFYKLTAGNFSSVKKMMLLK